MAEIFTDAMRLGSTLPDALRNARELGVSMLVSLVRAEQADALIALRDDRPNHHWDWPLEELRRLAFVGSELTHRSFAEHGLSVERPMLLYELLRRYTGFPRAAGRVLLHDGNVNLVEHLRAELERVEVSAQAVCYLTATGDVATQACQYDIPTLWAPPLQPPVLQWLAENQAYAPPYAGGLLVPETYLPENPDKLQGLVAKLQQRYPLYVDFRRSSGERRERLRGLKQAGVAGLLVEDPVLALYA